MKRDIFKPLIAGAIIISIIMAFNFYIPIVTLFFLFIACLLSYYYLRVRILRLFIFIVGITIISSISLLRIRWSASSHYAPFKYSSDYYGDVLLTKDASTVKGGYICEGIITGIHNKQFSSHSRLPVTVFCKKYLYSGDLLKNKRIRKKGESYSCNISMNDPIENISFYYSFRKKTLEGLMNRIQSPLLAALLIGKKSRLETGVIDLFRRCGCSHILALSGFHVGVIVLLVLTFFRLLVNLKLSYIITILFLVYYVTLAGITPSLLRSLMMFLIAVIFKVRSTRVSLLSILVLTFYSSIIISPGDFYSLSFQLSYLALSGILLSSREIMLLPVVRKFPILVKLPLSASLSAMIFTSYICYPVFGEIYPVGLIASILITPIVTLFIWIGILSLLVPIPQVILEVVEQLIYRILEYYSNYPSINESSAISSFVPFILFIIPVILVIIKIYRRLNARRFNIKFKL